MSTIKDKLDFSYNGIESSSFGLINVSLDSGMFEEYLVSTRNINESRLIDNKRSLYTGMTKEPIEFQMTIAFENDFTDEKISKVIDWLYGSEYYSPLIFHGYDKIFYCMPNGDSTLVHTGMNEGYINLYMKTNSPYVFGNFVTHKLKSTTSMNQNINLVGRKNPDSRISVKVISGTSVKIKMNNYTVQVNKLKAGETITIYPVDEDIKSNIVGVFHYSDYIGDLSKLTLTNKINILSVEGDVELEYKYQPYYDK